MNQDNALSQHFSFQFENHYVDSCFSLSQSGAVTIVGENDSSPLDHDYDTFSWEYSEESNLLFITQQLENSRQISTFILEIEEQFEQGLNGCWSVQLGITTDLVCHCGFTNNPDYM